MPAPASAPVPEPLDRRTLVVAAVVMLGAIMTILDVTIVNVAIDRLATEFGAPLTTIQWVVTGYTLALTAVIPLTGWAADRFGTKRIYQISLALFVLGSGLCGAAWDAHSLIGFRVLQGIGGGMIMPAVMTIVTHAAGQQRVGRVMSILGVPMLLAPLAGPILGGWLVDDVSWRAIFLVNVPIGIVALIAAQVVLDPDRPQPGHRLDWLGVALLSPGLALMIYGLAESATDGFGAPKALIPLVVGLAMLVAFFLHSRRATAPLIDVRTFTHTRAGAAAGTFFVFAIAFFGSMLLIPLYYQTVRDASALQAGLLLAPQGLGAMVTMPIGGRLMDRIGPEPVIVAGFPLMILGIIPFVLVGADTSYVLLCVGGFVLGLGQGLAMMPTMTAAMQAVPATAIAQTSTAMNIIRQAGASVGTAVVSVLLTHALATRLGATGGDGGPGALHQLDPGERARIAGQVADAFGSTFLWAMVLLAVAALPALAMYRSHRRARSGGSPDDAPVAVGLE